MLHQPGLFDEQASFLKEVWDRVRSDGRDPATTFVILPSNRAGTFFRSYYQRYGNPVEILPQIITLNSFISRFSTFRSIDMTTALAELYVVYKEQEGIQDFEDFMRWGQLALNDFNEIDSQLADAAALFVNLREIKGIDDWSYDTDSPSEGQKSRLQFWDLLRKLYPAYNRHLRNKNLCYTGMQVKDLALSMTPGDWARQGIFCYFAGFNALNRAEELLLTNICQAGAGRIYWDVDNYYLQDARQEAGKFFPRETRPYEERIYGDLCTGNIAIEITGVPRNISQAKVAGNILATLEASELSRTAVILADESLVIPLLNSLPVNVTAVNVTMGLPLRYSPMYSFFEGLFSVREELVSGVVNTTLVAELLRHARLFAYAGTKEELFRKLQGREAVSSQELSTLLEEEGLKLLDIFFSPWPAEGKDICNSLRKCVAQLRSLSSGDKENPFEREFLYSAAVIINNISELLGNYPFLGEPRLIQKLFTENFRKFKIPLVGEPLKGLQVMGMLESRSLDFENMIILGANEGLMPAAEQENSLITHDLKKFFGLPTSEKKEAIYAYYVYRLLHRSKKVHFIYNNITEDSGSGEKSRYLLQLAEELRAVNPRAVITENQLELMPVTSSARRKKTAKNEAALEKIRSLLTGGISPSAINTYLECPLDFYYKYILSLPEKKSEEALVSSADHGTLVHDVLETIYNEYKGRVVTVRDLESAARQLPEYLDSALGRVFPLGATQGKAFLTREIAGRQLAGFLAHELNQVRNGRVFTFLEAEKKVNHEFAVMLSGYALPVKIAGKLDRIEMENGMISVLDYKTGRVDPASVIIEKEADFLKKPKALQLGLYALMLKKYYPESQIRSGLIPMRAPTAGPCMLKLKNGSDIYTSEVNEYLENALGEVFEDMLDPEKAFTHREKYMSFCNYCT